MPSPTPELARIIARAASPDERATAPCFRAVPVDPTVDDADARLASRREAAWIAALGVQDRAAFLGLLAQRGITEDEGRRRLLDVELVPGTPLPRWAIAFLELFADPPGGTAPATFLIGEMVDAATCEETARDPDAEWPFHPIFARPLHVAWDRLAAARRGTGVQLADTAARQMLAQLVRRWAALVAPLFLHRVTLEDMLGGHPGAPGATIVSVFFERKDPMPERWLALLGEYPVLARLLAISYAHWYDANVELCARLVADQEALARTFGDGALAPTAADGASPSLGVVVDCAADAGDTHGHGRTVTIVTCASGRKLVYKPKELRISAACDALVRSLNARGLTPDLHTRRILVRDGYAWEEFIAAAECETRGDVALYYRRIGMHARLLQVTNGSDFTCENVIAAGSHPVLIDLETFLSPMPRLLGAMDPLRDRLAAAAADSPFRSAIITAPVVGEPGRRTADIGALAPPDRRVTPFMDTTLRPRAEGGGDLMADFGRFGRGDATPRLAGEDVLVDAHLADVQAGYLDMSVVLRREASYLAGADGPFAAMADMPVRYIFRNTHVYARLLGESTRPAALRDGVARELSLERVWLAVTRARAPVALVQNELDALRRLDIPLFTSRAGSSSATLEEGEVPGLIDGNAIDRVRARLAALAARTDGDEEDLIRTTLFTLEPALAPSPSRTGRRSAPLGGASWLERAVAVTSAIAREALNAGDEAGWVGLGYHAPSDSWHFGPLPDDLFAGRCGVAAVLADVHALSGDAAIGAVARRALVPVIRRLHDAAVFCAERDAAAAPWDSHALRTLPPAGTGGIGGFIYLIDRAGHALGDQAIVNAARAVPLARTLDALAASGSHDVVSGAAGLLLGVLAVARRTSDPELLVFATRLAASLREGMDTTSADAARYPAGASWLHGIPAGSAGLQLALARLSRLTPGGSHAPRETPADRAVAARGMTIGDRLASLAASDARGDDTAPALAAIDALLGEVADASSTQRLLQLAELAITTHQIAGEPRHYDRAAALSTALVARFDRSGAWFADSLAADRHHIGAVAGTGAVAHLFAKLHAPADVPSLSLLS